MHSSFAHTTIREHGLSGPSTQRCRRSCIGEGSSGTLYSGTVNSCLGPAEDWGADRPEWHLRGAVVSRDQLYILEIGLSSAQFDS
jgi:hypothetical protein